jgi:hypothetical protein
MRLFISYARVDKPYCQQIVDLLDIHEVWYDHRLHAGQKWWEEILRRLAWCDGIIYLMSPDSVNSEYCQKELAIAEKLGKHIFPVLIHSSASIPATMREIQYADLSNGLDAKAVKHLLGAIYIAERQGTPQAVTEPAAPLETASPPEVDPVTVMDEAADALDAGQFDRAVFLLKTAIENGYISRFIDVMAVLQEAEAALDRQAYHREAEREYRPIVALVKRHKTFKIGCEAFVEYRKYFPDYDPDNLTALCLPSEVPSLEWCDVTPGEVYLERDKRRIATRVEAYKMGKYPITNSQYQYFIDAPDGYCADQWWTFSPDALSWHHEHPEPLSSSVSGDLYPRTNICWYEAMAFCLWLSDKTGLQITLPTQQQWLRAAQGDQHLLYPWGNRFDKTRCNTQEGEQKKITPVNFYEDGVSPFGVYDMAGNTWEWCATKVLANITGKLLNSAMEVNYVVQGGCFMGSQDRARSGFYYKLKPIYRYHSIGFRVICVT